MAKFVEVHYNAEALLLNLDKVDTILQAGSGSAAIVKGNAQELDESYEKMKTIIGAAQGGIPRSPGRMYDGA